MGDDEDQRLASWPGRLPAGDGARDGELLAVDQDGASAPAAGDTQHVVNLVFPVEVVMVGAGGLPEREREQLRAEMWQELHEAINRRIA